MYDTNTCIKCWAEVQPSNMGLHNSWHYSQDAQAVQAVHSTHTHALDPTVHDLIKKVEGLSHRVHLVEKRTDFKGHTF